MNFFEFMTNNPILSVILAIVFADLLLKLVNRTLRHWNIRKHGYPPPHCDADGDMKDDE